MTPAPEPASLQPAAYETVWQYALASAAVTLAVLLVLLVVAGRRRLR